MKILSIGNSFSQDAHKFRKRQLSTCLTVFSYIAGCISIRNYENFLNIFSKKL